VVIRSGSCFEFVQPLANGHLSVGIEPDPSSPWVSALIGVLVVAPTGFFWRKM
jgi:hypothetical protein